LRSMQGLHQARHRIARHAQVVLHGNLGRHEHLAHAAAQGLA
jgi:hypothetical protein